MDKLVTVTIQEVIERQEIERAEVLNNFNRDSSALALAELALHHGSGSAEAAGKLLLSMERGEVFNLQLLLRLDVTNRAHADIVFAGYRAHHLWPSTWMNETGADGNKIMIQIFNKWA